MRKIACLTHVNARFAIILHGCVTFFAAPVGALSMPLKALVVLDPSQPGRAQAAVEKANSRCGAADCVHVVHVLGPGASPAQHAWAMSALLVLAHALDAHSICKVQSGDEMAEIMGLLDHERPDLVILANPTTRSALLLRAGLGKDDLAPDILTAGQHAA
jgi:hypothetical protein